MARYCSDCTYLNPDKIKDNKAGYCYCSKINKFVWANNERCEYFSEAYARNNFKREDIYTEAKQTQNKYDGSLGFNIFIAVTLILLAIILKLLNII